MCFWRLGAAVAGIGCQGAGVPGTESDAGSGAARDLRAVLAQPAVFIEPGCPGQRRGKPGRQHIAFLLAMAVPCKPAGWPSLPCQLPKSRWREIFPKGN